MKINKRFTLLELLVVIAVMALLISVLMPSLGRARSAAFDAACKSNLRQITVWGFLYTKDWGVLPHNGPPRSVLGTANENLWYVNLSVGYWQEKTPEGYYLPAQEGQDSGAYTPAAETGPERFWSTINESNALHCPQLVNNGFKWWWQGVGNHYSMNRWMGGRRQAGTNEGPSIPRQHTLSSEAWWFSDGDLWQVGEGYAVYNDYSLHNPQYALVSGNQMPWVWEFKNSMQTHPKARANFAFGDGRVASITKAWVLALDDNAAPTKEDDLVEFNGRWDYPWR
ncbi:MAG: hypothetical protein NE330_15445 [Lentisphaeraceae bacterium]|nr:hypothetical protein [Lentisphaeraceae bacterium]